MSTQNQYVILIAVGPDNPGLLDMLTKQCAKHDCHIQDSKIQRIGQDITLIMSVHGNWHALAKLENLLPKIEKKTNLAIMCKRTEMPSTPAAGLPYQAQLIAQDRPGILSELCTFFTKHNIAIDECSADTYFPNQSSTKMCQLQINIRIPTKSHIAQLREKFIEYCERLNLDVLLEPLK